MVEFIEKAIAQEKMSPENSVPKIVVQEERVLEETALKVLARTKRAQDQGKVAPESSTLKGADQAERVLVVRTPEKVEQRVIEWKMPDPVVRYQIMIDQKKEAARPDTNPLKRKNLQRELGLTDNQFTGLSPRRDKYLNESS